MRRLLFAVLFVTSASAQGILPISDTYRVGQIVSEFGVCDPGAVPDVLGASGTITFDPDGTFGTSLDIYAVCASGTTITDTDSGGGAYQVRTDGRLMLDGLPALPGTEADMLYFRGDGSVATLTRDFEDQTDSFVAIAVALSSGQSDASLDGTYRIARLVLRNDGAHSIRTDRTEFVFDGAGGYSETGIRHSVVLGAAAADFGYGPVLGGYSVDPDGTLTVGTGIGAVSSDGEVLFWSRTEGAEVELAVGIRRRPTDNYVAQMLRGDWGVVRMENLIGAGTVPDGPFLGTASGTFTLTPQNPTTGMVSAIDNSCETDAVTGLTACEVIQVNDSFSLSADGTMSLAGAGVAVSADATFFVGTLEDPDGGGIIMGISSCKWPTPIGTATPGSGGASPGITPVGGFPYAGNPDFGLVIHSGLGAAPAALVFSNSAAPPAGVPTFGGTAWIDPFSVFASLPVTLSGPLGAPGVGAAGIPLPIPGQAVLGGAKLYLQAVVIDAGAPMGFAFTSGLELGICR